MSTTKQDEDRDKLDTFQNDLKVRQQQEQTSTNLDHALAAAADISGGRFGVTGVPNVIGSAAIPQYPAASSAHQTELPPEPALGYSVDQVEPIEPSMAVPPVVEDRGPAEAPSSEVPPSMSENAAGPTSSPETEDGNA
jgi:hypothetical protein